MSTGYSLGVHMVHIMSISGGHLFHLIFSAIKVCFDDTSVIITRHFHYNFITAISALHAYLNKCTWLFH